MKKHLLKPTLALLLMMLICSGRIAAATPGDANGDGLVNLVDAIYALQVSAGIRDVPLTDDIQAKNVIFMVADGMGLADVAAARIYQNGPNGPPLHFETLPYIGYQRTHSRNTLVTDSAAAASAWASGEKFDKGAISCRDEAPVDGVCDETRKNSQTLLEIAQAAGKSTGLVVTSDITHATPAAFGAHVHNRNCGAEIFRQYLNMGIDVLLGGYVAENKADKGCLLPEENPQALIDQASSLGYNLVDTRDEMMVAADSVTKMLGLFSGVQGGLCPLYLRSDLSTQPTLTQMTTSALKILETNPNGFFLLVEGSQIDWANHANNLKYQIEETLDFDSAVKVVIDWINLVDERQRNTLIIVTADHETGGFAINGPTGRLAEPGDTTNQYKGLTDEDGNPIMAPDIVESWTSTYHTAVDTLIWSNSRTFSQAMDNTDLYDAILGLMH